MLLVTDRRTTIDVLTNYLRNTNKHVTLYKVLPLCPLVSWSQHWSMMLSALWLPPNCCSTSVSPDMCHSPPHQPALATTATQRYPFIHDPQSLLHYYSKEMQYEISFLNYYRGHKVWAVLETRHSACDSLNMIIIQNKSQTLQALFQI